MFRSKPNTGPAASSSSSQCRKHPKHKQSPGVCSLCLTQRLVKISSMGVTRDALCRRVYSDEGSSCTSSQMSYSSSSDVSSCVSSCVSPGRELDLMTKKKKKEKSRFWTRLALISSTRKKTSGYFQGKLVLSHSEPLPTTITTAT